MVISEMPSAVLAKIKSWYTSATDCPMCPFIVIFLPKIRPHPFTKSDRKGCGLTVFFKTEKFKIFLRKSAESKRKPLKPEGFRGFVSVQHFRCRHWGPSIPANPQKSHNFRSQVSTCYLSIKDLRYGISFWGS